MVRLGNIGHRIHRVSEVQDLCSAKGKFLESLVASFLFSSESEVLNMNFVASGSLTTVLPNVPYINNKSSFNLETHVLHK